MYPIVESINRIPHESGATNMQNIKMLQLQNLLVPTDGSVVGTSAASATSAYQNPMAQFMPYSMSTAGKFSFALGGGDNKKRSSSSSSKNNN